MRKFRETTKKEINEFSIAGSVFFVVVFGLLIPLIFSLEFKPWPFIVGGVFLSFRIIPYKIVNIIYYPWIIIAHFIGSVNQVIILGFVFYFILTPMGLLKRVFGKDSMNRKIDPSIESYRIKSDPSSDMNFPF